MSEPILSEIQITPVKFRDGLVAFSSFIYGQFYVGCVGIYSSPSSPDGFRLVYPTKILNNGTQLSIVYPINKDIGSVIQKCIVEKYLKLIENLTKGDVYE